MEPPPSGVLRFGALALDLATGELRGMHAPVALGARPTRLLAVLAWHHGRLVTREQIQRAVWADGITVDFDQSINQHVRQLRQVLGDDAARPRWIQTLPGRGYRFLVASELAPAAVAPAPPAEAVPAEQIVRAAPLPPADEHAPLLERAPVEHVLPAEDAPRADHPRARAPSPIALGARRDRLHRAARRVGLVGLLGLAAAGLLLAAGPGAATSTPDAPAPLPATGALRLAVLPLDTDDPEAQPRALGMTDELITALGEAYAPALEVIALRTVLRFRGGAAPLSSVARELGVELVLEGRLRAHPGGLRINVRLVRARDSAQQWAGSFALPASPPHAAADAAHAPEAADADAPRGPRAPETIEAVIARDVAAALGRVLLPARARPDVALDDAARHDYHRGRYLLRRGDPREAARALASVTARFPRSARAWAALALAELRADSPRSRAAVAAAHTALELDPAHPEAHLVRAIVALYGEWDPARARRHLEAAIAANPAYAEAHHSLAAAHATAGRHDAALAAMQRALVLDPLAPEVVSDVGWYHYVARRYADAATWCRRTLAFEPRFHWARRCIVQAEQQRGDLPAAIAAALDDLRARGAHASAIAAVTRDGLAPYWRWDLAHREASPPAGAADRAVARIALGDRAGALDDLAQAVAARRGWLLPFLAVDPTFDGLRGDPRFDALCRTIAAGAAL